MRRRRKRKSPCGVCGRTDYIGIRGCCCDRCASGKGRKIMARKKSRKGHKGHTTKPRAHKGHKVKRSKRTGRFVKG